MAHNVSFPAEERDRPSDLASLCGIGAERARADAEEKAPSRSLCRTETAATRGSQSAPPGAGAGGVMEPDAFV